MTVYKNVSGTWKPVQHIWRNINGVWTKVRKLFHNDSGNWVQYHGDQDFQVYSLGLLQNQVSNALQGITPNGQTANRWGGGRSYNLVQFDKYGNVTFERQYDIYGEGQNGSPSASPYGSAQFVADTNAMANGQRFCLFTYDEPQTGTQAGAHPITAFINAVLSLGATVAIFQSSSFAYRGAYLLLGAKGSAATFEAYRGTESTNIGTGGTDSGCLDGVVGISFTINNGSYTNLTRLA